MSEPRRCYGGDIAEHLGNEQTDIGYKGDEQQRNQHTGVERQGCLDNLFHGTLGDRGSDEQNCTDRGCQQTDAAVQHDDDAKLDRVDADGGGNGQQDGGGNQNQDDGQRVDALAQLIPDALPIQALVAG